MAKGFFSSLLPLAGTAVGSYFGGPMGGAIGGQIGGMLGGAGRSRGRGGDMGNPSDAANGYLNQIPGMARQYLEPYLGNPEAGRVGEQTNYENIKNMYQQEPNIYSSEIPEYQRMRQDPQEFMNNIMRGYTPSEGYKFKEKMMSNALRNTAASGGYSGNSFNQMQAGDLVKGLLGDDMGEYLRNILGIQQGGLGAEERRRHGYQGAQEFKLGGAERGFGGLAEMNRNRSNQSYDAAKALSGILGTNLGSQATLGYMGQNEMNRERMSRRREGNDLLSQAMGSTSQLFSPGGFFGKKSGPSYGRYEGGGYSDQNLF